MWTYNNYELYHYGVVGMKWGVRKARMKERVALRRAAGAATDKRKEAFLKKANEYNDMANSMSKSTTPKQTDTMDKGKRITKGVLLGIGGVTVAAITASVIGTRKTLKDMNIDPKEFKETAKMVYQANKKK